MDSTLPRVLVVDDMAEIGILLQRVLAGRGGLAGEVVVEADAQRALKRIREERFDVVVTDYRMPFYDGLALLQEARRANPRCFRVLMTAYPELPATADDILGASVDAYLLKPFRPDDLRALLHGLLHGDRERIFGLRSGAREFERLRPASAGTNARAEG